MLHIPYNTKPSKDKTLELLRFSLEPQMFSHEFQSAFVLVDVVLMQTQKFFSEYSQGDLTVKVLSHKSFVLSTHSKQQCVNTICIQYYYTQYLAIVIYVYNYVASTYVRLL